MSYTIGTTIAPPLVRPFLSYHLTNQTTPSDQLTHRSGVSGPLLLENNSSNSNNTFQESQIYYPYAGIGMVEGLVCVSYFLLCLSGRMRQSVSHMEPKSLKDMVKPTTCRHGSTAFWKILMVCVVLLYVGIVSRDQALGLYMCPLGVDAGLTKQTAVWLSFVYNASLLVGRIFSVFMAPFVKVHLMAFVECILILICLMTLVLFSTLDMDGTIYLWIMVPITGLFIGPNYASLMAWVDRYIEVTGLVVATIDVGIGLGSLLSTWAVGLLIHRYGGTVCYWFSLGGAVLVLMTLVPAQIMGLIEGDRHDIVEVTDTDQDVMTGEPDTLQNPLLSIQDDTQDDQNDVLHQSEDDNPWVY